MGAVIGGDAGWITLYQDKSGRTYIKGLWETRRKLMEMGMERNEFERLIKISAKIVAAEATRQAPVMTGRLAQSIRGMASKKFTVDGVAKRAYGGVVLGRTPYARATSYGMYHVAGEKAKSNNSKRGYATRVWRETVRGAKNAFMVKAREASKPRVVQFWSITIRNWIKRKGFEPGSGF